MYCVIACRHCSSKPVSLPPTTSDSSRIKQQQHNTSTRVESWLLNGHHMSTQSLVSAGLSPSHRGVHFAEGCGYNRKWVGSDSHTLDSGCEDTRSSSSVTSGIVTDCPVSPYVKSFPCFNCNNADTHSLSTNLPSTSDDGFHTLTRCGCQPSSLSNTLLSPSNMTSRAGSLDAIIDEPVAENIDSRCESRGQWRLYRMKQKKPATPNNLSAYFDPTDKHWIIVEWTPVR